MTPSHTEILRICAWCGLLLGTERWPWCGQERSETHGICDGCQQRAMSRVAVTRTKALR